MVGATSIQVAIAGRITSIRAKPAGAEYDRGRAIGTIEGIRFFGPIRTPVRATLVAVNDALMQRPRMLSDSPYEEGWFARLQPVDWLTDRGALGEAAQIADTLSAQIRTLRVRCFAASPDYEMVEIGTECAAVLAKLRDFVRRMEVGEVLHLVSDDWTAPIEMERWSGESGQPVIESRREGNLYHFLVRKAR